MIYSEDIQEHLPFLYQMAAKSKFIIELGYRHGNGSALAFDKGLKDSIHNKKLYISVDIDESSIIHKPEYSKEYWYFIKGNSLSKETVNEVQKLKILLFYSEHPDIIFFDTLHTYEHIRQELEVWDVIAGINTIYLFHDTYENGVYNPMTDAIKEFGREYEMLYYDISKENNGLGMLIHKRNLLR